jgi:hypothetical protein
LTIPQRCGIVVFRKVVDMAKVTFEVGDQFFVPIKGEPDGPAFGIVIEEGQTLVFRKGENRDAAWLITRQEIPLGALPLNLSSAPAVSVPQEVKTAFEAITLLLC